MQDAFRSEILALTGNPEGTRALCTERFTAVDTNGDGKIDKSEVVSFYLTKNPTWYQEDAEAIADWLC